MPAMPDRPAPCLLTDPFQPTGPRLPMAAPLALPARTALMVVGDVHGQRAAFEAVLRRFARIPTPGARRHLVLLGDLIDRGPDSLGCLALGMEDAADMAGADAITHLPGNHELMLADALDAVRRVGRAGLNYDDRETVECWLYNGGMEVIDEALGRERGNIRAAMAALDDALTERFGDLVARIRTWPSHLRLGNVLAVHAGLDPRQPQADFLAMAQAGHRTGGGRHWAWIRDPFLRHQGGWPADGMAADATAPGNLVLHGHTVPRKLEFRGLRDEDDLRLVLDRSETNARLCLDGGAARRRGVAGAVMAGETVRLAWAPCGVMG
mgnify:CR=1 FL=1